MELIFKVYNSKRYGMSDSDSVSRGLEPLLTESESAVLPITPFRIT